MSHRILSKADLCRIFGLYAQSSGRLYYAKLRELYFTDKALAELGISPEAYEKLLGGRQFTYEQSQAIRKYFEIREEELQNS